MSETLRDLVVSLSLQTDNFTRNIRSVNKQIAEAESKFKLAAAGVEGFEKTAIGLSTQLSTLERRLSLQKDAVTQYERALTAANGKLQECFTRQTDYAQRLTEAKTAQEALKEQVAAAAQQVREFSSTLGENDSATIAAKANLDALKTEYRASVQEVKKLAGQNTALQKSAQNAADAVSTASTNLNKARAAVKTTQAELESKLEAQIGELKDIKAKLEKFKEEASLGEARSFLTAAKTVGSLKVITAQRDGMDANALRKLGDFLRDKEPGVVGVLASVHDGKVTLLAVCGKDAVAKGVKAGDIIKAIAPICGGKGGGKPDSAMGGGTEVSKVDDALAAVDDLILSKLG